MTYNAADDLRAAGILSGEMSPELEEFYAGLTRAEAGTLISVKSRLEALLPDVVAHSYTAPEVSEQDFDASMLCMCGAWSGAGTGPEPQ
jgi:hypothetical protein